MTRRRRSGHSVSLFPFLAVLVCTMGALILLLLVTTRQIRRRQQQPALVQLLPSTSEAIDDSTKASPAGTPDKAVFFDGQIMLTQQPEVEVVLEFELSEYDALLEEIDRHERLLRSAQESREALEADLQRLTAATQVPTLLTTPSAEAEAEGDRTLLEDRLQAAVAALRTVQDEGNSNGAEMSTLNGQLADAALEEATLRGELKMLRQQILEAQSVARGATGQTQVEFRGSTGTARAPIILELTNETVRMPAVSFSLAAEDLKGWTRESHPLLQAVYAYRRSQNPMAMNEQPYVLLLVRPSAARTFYDVQAALRAANLPYGFELVGEDRTFHVPSESAEVAQLVAVAADHAMSEGARLRVLVADAVPSGNPTATGRHRGGLETRPATADELRLTPQGTIRPQSRGQAGSPSAPRTYAGGMSPAGVAEGDAAGLWGHLSQDASQRTRRRSQGSSIMPPVPGPKGTLVDLPPTSSRDGASQESLAQKSADAPWSGKPNERTDMHSGISVQPSTPTSSSPTDGVSDHGGGGDGVQWQHHNRPTADRSFAVTNRSVPNANPTSPPDSGSSEAVTSNRTGVVGGSGVQNSSDPAVNSLNESSAQSSTPSVRFPSVDAQARASIERLLSRVRGPVAGAGLPEFRRSKAEVIYVELEDGLVTIDGRITLVTADSDQDRVVLEVLRTVNQRLTSSAIEQQRTYGWTAHQSAPLIHLRYGPGMEIRRLRLQRELEASGLIVAEELRFQMQAEPVTSARSVSWSAEAPAVSRDSEIHP